MLNTIQNLENVMDQIESIEKDIKILDDWSQKKEMKRHKLKNEADEIVKAISKEVDVLMLKDKSQKAK